jgi:hypothetical protein
MVGQIKVSMVNEFLVPIKADLKPIILELSSTYGWVCFYLGKHFCKVFE